METVIVEAKVQQERLGTHNGMIAEFAFSWQEQVEKAFSRRERKRLVSRRGSLSGARSEGGALPRAAR